MGSTAANREAARRRIAARRRMGICLVFLLSAATVFGSPQKKKLSVENVMELLSGGVALPRITQLVNDRGVDFSVDARMEQTILDSGGDPNLIAALRQQSGGTAGAPLSASNVHDPSTTPFHPEPALPKPVAASGAGASPNIVAVARVLVRSKPGGVAIFLDGQPQGITDEEEGQLDVGVSKLGKHVLRASREGYQDVEATLDVARGQVLETPVWLSQVESLPAKTITAPELPAGKKFRVRHFHRAIAGLAEAGYCQGWIVVNVGYVRFISTDSPHKYLMNTSSMKQAKSASGQGSFTIKLDFGREFQFVAIDESGAAVSPAPIIAEIRYSMGE